ncbi:Uncharacterised protein [Mycobacterium tuberculosis]|nr:Uncharacterised protein [Mycobacterium tuberculosis]CKR58620.1 Uncharacterised protein [Mycobacterium tuberculosis]
MVASGPDVRGDRRLASGWLAHRDALGGARAAQLGRQGIRHRRRADGVHAGLTARVRRRPHRRHRQHHPQADERRTPTPCRRVLLFTGPLHGGLRAGGNAGDRTQGYRRTGRERLLDAASLHRLDRYQHFRRVPVFDRHPQRHRPGRHRACLRPPAPRRLRRSRTRTAVGQPRTAHPVPRPLHQVTHQVLAYVPGRIFVRSRVRHRHRDRAVGAGGNQCRGRPALVCHPVPARLVRRRHVSAGHHRRFVHEFRVRLGLLQPRAQDLLQHHRHRTVGGSRTVDWQR